MIVLKAGYKTNSHFVHFVIVEQDECKLISYSNKGWQCISHGKNSHTLRTFFMNQLETMTDNHINLIKLWARIKRGI